MVPQPLRLLIWASHARLISSRESFFLVCFFYEKNLLFCKLKVVSLFPSETIYLIFSPTVIFVTNSSKPLCIAVANISGCLQYKY